MLTKPSPSTQDPTAMPTLLYFEMGVYKPFAEGYTLEKEQQKRPPWS